MIGHDHNHVPTLRERINDSNAIPNANALAKAAYRPRESSAGLREAMLRRSKAFIACTAARLLPVLAYDRKSGRSRGFIQEAFLRVFRKIQTFRGESAFSTWLHRLATNVVLMHLRKKKFTAISLDETPRSNEEGAPVGNEVGGPDVMLAGLIDRVNLKRAVEQLPTATRWCLCSTTSRAISTRRSPK